MPLMALLHLLFQYFMLKELADGEDDDISWLSEIQDAFYSIGNLTAGYEEIVAGVGASTDSLLSVSNLALGGEKPDSDYFEREFGRNESQDALSLIGLSIRLNGFVIAVLFLMNCFKRIHLPTVQDKLQA